MRDEMEQETADSLYAKNSQDPLRRLRRLLRIATTKYIVVRRHQFRRRTARVCDSITYSSPFALSIKWMQGKRRCLDIKKSQ